MTTEFIMENINSSFLLLLLLLLPLFFMTMSSFTAALLPPYVGYNCQNTTTFTPNSTYQHNLISLLSSLASNSTSPPGFYKHAIGSFPDDVYGLFLCRGDVSIDMCRACVNTAHQEIGIHCPIQKTSIIYYDNCMLRYASVSFFSTVDYTPAVAMYNRAHVSNRSNDHFMKVLAASLNETARKAVNDRSGKKFGTGKEEFTNSLTIYTLAQCIPDLSLTDCDLCLQLTIAALPSSLSSSEGGRMLFPSCNIRYEFYQFYNEIATPAPLSPPSSATSAPFSPLSKDASSRGRKTLVILIPAVLTFLSIVLLGLLCMWRRKSRKAEDLEINLEVQLFELDRGYTEGYSSNENSKGVKSVKSKNYPFWPLDIILTATQHFSSGNKLGEDGFGPVYKGILADGKEIAVKRLSRGSGQGLQEFKNEVTLIVKLQQRNLVRLLGCCLEGNEKLLIYEFMPNKSLDFFIFDSSKGAQLDWGKRFSIINRIARGLLYLHEDSRLKIIHRDLKTSNILLDHEMNPRISDFGMARIFQGNQIEASTNRVVGTYGYMAPEYAMEGLFSVNSDVFSFGVLLLEIISGKRNNGFYLSESGQSLLTFAWNLWSKDNSLELMDLSLGNSYVSTEVSKCIHIGLLCVQDNPADRPTMSYVIMMLTSNTTMLSQPKKPAFSVGREVQILSQSRSDAKALSINDATLSAIAPR